MSESITFGKANTKSLIGRNQGKKTFNPVNPCARLTYEEMMEIYIADGDSGLKEYLNKRKQEGSLSEAEEDYWKFAMDNGMTKEMFRKRILEMHDEDRKKDPLNIKVSRLILAASHGVYVFESEELSKENMGIGNTATAEDVIKLGVALKCFFLEKLAGNHDDMDTIFEKKEAEIIAQSDKIVKAIEHIRKAPIETLDGRVNENQHPISTNLIFPHIGEHILAVRDYYEGIMPQYVERYLEAKREGRLSEVIPNKKLGLAIGISIKDFVGSIKPRDVGKSAIQHVSEEWAKHVELDNQEYGEVNPQYANLGGVHGEGRISNNETR